ncbi:MAG: hypothetical protein R3B45_05235 [Bdellovibrionota bacterium]
MANTDTSNLTADLAKNSTATADHCQAYGRITKIEDLSDTNFHKDRLANNQKHKLGQLAATAICGNDITSSCLYVSALCAIQAGPYAPIALAIVAAVLYLFRKIYAEVGKRLAVKWRRL